MMLRGCQKEMIMLKTGESRLFERAFFVLRRGGPADAGDNMLAEATRLLALAEGIRPVRRRWGRGAIFAAGLLCGIGIFAIFRFVFGW